METVDSTQGPPNVTASVDMGMNDDSLPTGAGSIGSYPSRRKPKKQVVLKKNHTRINSINMSQKFAQSQANMPMKYSQVEVVTSMED